MRFSKEFPHLAPRTPLTPLPIGSREWTLNHGGEVAQSYADSIDVGRSF
jgi:hypothetical protein